jgi:hypothetical protein
MFFDGEILGVNQNQCVMMMVSKTLTVVTTFYTGKLYAF